MRVCPELGAFVERRGEIADANRIKTRVVAQITWPIFPLLKQNPRIEPRSQPVLAIEEVKDN